MAFPSLRASLSAGSGFTAWIGIPEPLIAELAARAGFDSVTLDMQHGLHDPVSIMRAIGSVSAAGVPAVVRIPVGDFAMASRALDMGAAAVIAPMINSKADAERFAAAMKYPPDGERSWGPTRLLQIANSTDTAALLASANRDTVSFAMIETRAALDALDDILGVPGIDAIFIGPSDLSIALSDGKRVNAMAPDNQAIAASILERTQKAGKFAGIFATTGEQGRLYRGLGYDFVALGNDSIYLNMGAKAMLREAREV